MQPHKNVKRLVNSYIFMRDNFNEIQEKLLIVGKTSYGDEVLEIIKNSNYKDDVIVVGFVPLEDLPSFYSGATSLVYISLNEGFGMPLAESMACGSPVITSNVSAMPEVAGDAAILVDPYNTELVAKAMREVSINHSLRNDLIEKGYVRAKLFTWNNYTGKILETYKKLLNK